MDQLVLSFASTCSPSWIPAFGAEPGTSDDVLALTVHDDGTGPELYAGGNFTSALDSGDSFIARWRCPLVTTQARVRRR